ncbi:MAG: hypothetical protein DWH91_13625 [Planctomycetota bacterium]|nr:MAG: hypothetical protein DWH91_13625 [Planctomycetota bacterium]
MLTGAVLLAAAEQAYSHANLVQFPNHIEARSVLIPASLAFLCLGFLILTWGLLTENPKSTPSSPPSGKPS